MPVSDEMRRLILGKQSASLSEGLSPSVDESQLAGSIGLAGMGSSISASAAELLRDASRVRGRADAGIKPIAMRTADGFVDQGKLHEILSKVRAGDMLFYPDDDVKGLMSKLTTGPFGQVRAHHSEVFLPDSNGNLKLYIPGNPDVSSGARLRSPLLGVLTAMLQKGKFKLQDRSNWRPDRLVGSVRKDWNRFSTAREMAKRLSKSPGVDPGQLPAKLLQQLDATPHSMLVLGDMINKGKRVAIARAGKSPMSKKKVKMMMQSTANGLETAFAEPDTWEMGVRRFLLPRRMARVFAGEAPLGCSDGLCKTTDDIVGWGKGLHTPQDLMNNPNVRVTADMAMTPVNNWSKDVADGLRRSAKIRGAVGLPLAALGAAGIYGSVGRPSVDPSVRADILKRLRSQ